MKTALGATQAQLLDHTFLAEAPLSRRIAPIYLLRSKVFRLRLADNAEGRNQASMLVRRRYAWRNYGDDHQIEGRPGTVTVTGSVNGHVVATLSLNIDVPGTGLLADATFTDVIDAYRGRGERLCECTKLAIDNGVDAPELLAPFFHLLYLHASVAHERTMCVIEVNPRHVALYRRKFHFMPVVSDSGKIIQRIAGRVGHPSVLMILPFSEIERSATAFGGKHYLYERHIERSYYPYFFSPREADGLRARIAIFP